MTRVPLLLLPLLLLAACGDSEPASTPPARDPGLVWGAGIAYEAGKKLGGCTVGDVDLTHAGNEIAAVAATGEVYVLSHDEEGWHGGVVAKAGGEMISCAVGDADPTRPGNELVVGGMAEGTEESGGEGAAHLVFLDADGWKIEPLFEDAALVHGVAVGEVDPTHPGAEVVCVGFSRKLTVLGRTDAGWATLYVADLPSPGKNVVVDGGRIVAVCAGGTRETIVCRDARTWAGESRTIGPVGPARVSAHGDEILVACDDGGLRLLRGEQPAEVLYREADKLRGAVLADLDPDAPGLEAATAGYGKTITVLFRPNEGETEWSPLTVWRDTDRFHHLAAGELLAAGAGLELVAVGYSGRVVVASRRR